MEGQHAVALIIAEQIDDALHGRPYQNAVNIPFMKSQLPTEMRLYFDLAEKMGKLAVQLAKGRTSRIGFVMVGKMFEEDLCERKFDVPFSFQPFTIAALKGFLDVSSSDAVTYINAPYLATDRKITVEESKTEQFDKFNDLIVVQATTDVGEIVIAGTVFSDGRGRVVLYDGFRLDIVPEGAFLHFRILDRPGIIGKVATILGDNSINIASFGLSRAATGEEIAFVSVDHSISADVLAKIQAIDGMIEASVIHL